MKTGLCLWAKQHPVVLQLKLNRKTLKPSIELCEITYSVKAKDKDNKWEKAWILLIFSSDREKKPQQNSNFNCTALRCQKSVILNHFFSCTTQRWWTITPTKTSLNIYKLPYKNIWKEKKITHLFVAFSFARKNWNTFWEKLLLSVWSFGTWTLFEILSR